MNAKNTRTDARLTNNADSIVDLDFAISSGDADRAVRIASDLAADPANHAELTDRLLVRVGAPSVPGAQYGSYHAGKTMVYLRGFGAPCRFDARLRGVLAVWTATTDRRSQRLAVEDAPLPRGVWTWLAARAEFARTRATKTAAPARR